MTVAPNDYAEWYNVLIASSHGRYATGGGFFVYPYIIIDVHNRVLARVSNTARA